MRNKHTYSSLLLFFLCISSVVFAQTGNYFVQNFLPKTYLSGANNFGVTQDSNGVIFIANRNGVLIYDGINWDICKREDEISINCIGKTFSGEIVVGADDGDIAVITKNPRGIYVYKTLFNSTNKKFQESDVVRQIICLGERTYFLSSDRLIERSKTGLKFFKPIGKFNARAWVLGEHLFVTELEHYISVLINGKLKSIAGTDELAREKSFFSYSINKTKHAIGFRNQGIYFAYYNPHNPEQTRFEKVKSDCDPEIISSGINNGCLMSNGNFIVTTNTHGAFELDTNLKIVRRYNTKNGIYDNNIKAAFQDRNGNLWLPLYYGIAYVETNSRLFTYTRNDGISGLVQSAVFFENKLFIATDKGVQYYDSLEEKFLPFSGFNFQTWFLYSSKHKLFIGADKGLFVYENGKTKQINEIKTNYILSDPDQSELLYVATNNGLESYWIKDNKIEFIKAYQRYNEIKSIAFDSNKNLFFVSDNHTIYYLNYSKENNLDSIAEVDALPKQKFETYLFAFKNKLLLGTDTGIYSLVKKENGRLKCVRDNSFWPFTNKSQVFRASQFSDGIICYQRSFFDSEKNKSEEKINFIQENALLLHLKPKSISHLNDVVPASINYDSLQNLVFISSNEGLFILKNRIKEEAKRFNLILQAFISKKDTLLAYCSYDNDLSPNKYVIPFKGNDLTFVYGFTGFEATNKEFSYKLLGRDSDFSKWRKTNNITLSNLNEGNYTLTVKARTDLEEKEYVLKIPFTISPPWYRSIYAYLVYALLFLAFIYVVVKLNSKRLIELNKKLEKTIEERTYTISHQKEEIEHKQKEILDSINYAQRIQRALLASEKLLKKNLPEYFVFFQPKDVVSGDFYWAAELSNKQFALVTADSTGHGVPGAIMSMLNISCLKEAVESEKLISAKDILNHTRKKVIETLANDGSESGGKDGMDCSLLCLDLKNNKFTYAAANNPVWIVRKNSLGENELIELSPDKMPVGKHDRDSISFNEHVFELQNNDVIYTLTDGLPDQFGGTKGKKFMYKQLKELLVSISHMNMLEQKKQINNSLQNWMGNNEQVDDICLIGVRV